MPVYVPNPHSGPVADLIEELGAALSAQYAVLEEQLIALVAKYARNAIDTPPDVNARLRAIRDLKERSLALLDTIDPAQLAREVLAVAEAEGTAAAARRLGLVGIANTGSNLSTVSASAIAQMSLDLSNRLNDMRGRILRWAPDAYQHIIALTTPSVLAGVDTLRNTEKRAVEKFLARGITGYVNRQGRPMRIGSYAEMATRTAVNRAWQFGNIDRLAQNEIHLVQIIIGVDACKACAATAGKVYSTDGTPGGSYTLTSLIDGRPVQIEVSGTLDEARANGWNHPNCRCVVAGVLPGLVLTSDASTYDPKAEKARDELRALERGVRDAKRKAAAAMDDLDAKRWARIARQKQAAIRAHVAETGQARKPYRESLSFADGRNAPTLPKLRAVSPPRTGANP